jgi:hypothetical protein
MNRELVDKIAHAMLYEGYVLYPYRPSVKNRQRWTFGGIYPKAWSDAQNGTDAWTMQTECLAIALTDAKVQISVRFLHLVDRTVCDQNSQPVNSLNVGDKSYRPWQEALERDIELGEIHLADLLVQSLQHEFSFPEDRSVEPLKDAGFVVRQQQGIAGMVELSTVRVNDELCRIAVKILNHTPLPEAANRDIALMRSFVSTHTLLGIYGGEFVSSIDPPEECRAALAECRNVGAWPVLVGEAPQRDTMLSSPIILYDYPQIAPESPSDLFDSTEIDEILTLRIMTLTDDEKRDAIAMDERVRDVLARTDSLARDQLMTLHGTVRGLRPVPQEQRNG